MAYNYNPYEEEMIRRRQQQQPEMPQFQQPAPMVGLPLYSGPEQEQWVPMGDGGQSQDFSAAGAGMADLIRRFKRPSGAKATGGYDAAKGVLRGLG